MCNSKKSKFLKEHFFSSLGRRTSLSQIPMLGSPFVLNK